MIPGTSLHTTGTDLRALWQTQPAMITTTVLWAPSHRLNATVAWVTVWSPEHIDGDLAGHLLLVRPDLALLAIDYAVECGSVAIATLGAAVDLDPDVLAAARVRNIAIATVESALTPTRLARQWNTQLVQARDRRAEEALDLHEQLARALLANAGISGALRLALRPLPEVEAVAFSYFGEIVGSRQPSARILTEVEGLFITAKRLLRDQDWAEEKQPDGTTITAVTVRVFRNPEVFLAFRSTRVATDRDRIAFRHCAVAVLLELGRQQTVRRARRSAVEPFLRGLDEGSLSLSDARNQLQNLGFQAVEGYRVLCLNAPVELSTGQVCSLAEDALETSGTPVVGSIDEHIYCIIEESGTDQAQRLLEACVGRGWTGVRIGVSRVKSDAINLRAAMREANIAASQQSLTENGIQRVEDLGIQSMLAPLLSSDATTSFLAGLLGPLIERDGADDTRLLETLIAYFDAGCHPGPTAVALSLHRHSLGNRLDRIEALLGMDPRAPQHMLTFSLAVQLWKELGESGQRVLTGRVTSL
ncbi:helix-turn-helix domain-containing protein [Cryobacterium sp. PH31-L1]|uniref:PucR family transcriptional regulator n=1 Tax=Cryobacterium sp. PH31-L1 TaxID=3046199 RepID=UPI0024BA5781|nr:helix-turn-helix domain-containing protein [Cryobacterium sp. PH31-L1]MDJ0378456.1 helix-turn-helix domain-containing protein [Cryobacterium sp. PH31-L1]